jgi:dTMP kinase
MSGYFITLEGGEGAGKSTLARRLHSVLTGRGLKVLLTREPGGTPTAERIRDILVQKSEEVLSPQSETLLLYAARELHVRNVIKPALAAGYIVICDRFSDSTICYQGYAQGLDLDWIKQLHNHVLGDFAPDLTFLLDISAAEGLARSLKQKQTTSDARESKEDRFESQTLAFHEKLREGFLSLASQNPQRFITLNATDTPDSIATHALDILKQRKVLHAV